MIDSFDLVPVGGFVLHKALMPKLVEVGFRNVFVCH